MGWRPVSRLGPLLTVARAWDDQGSCDAGAFAWGTIADDGIAVTAEVEPFQAFAALRMVLVGAGPGWALALLDPGLRRDDVVVRACGEAENGFPLARE